jgi:hypothetical protein
MCFDFYFGVVIYRTHIIAQYKNMFDIADIHGDRKGRSGLFGHPIYARYHRHLRQDDACVKWRMNNNKE